MNLIAIDPGEEYTGIAFCKKMLCCKTLPTDEFREFISKDKSFEILIVEDFRLRKYLQNSRLGTVRLIGFIECISYLYDKELILQPASVKKIVFKNIKKNALAKCNNQHEKDALAHLTYYLRFKKKRRIDWFKK